MNWVIRYGDRTHVVPPGRLENELLSIRAQGVDEFTVEASGEDAGLYVPELAREDVPDTIPEDWDATDPT